MTPLLASLSILAALIALLWLMVGASFVVLELLTCLLSGERLSWRNLAGWLVAWPWRIR